ncbi:MAG: hypothetical protein OJF50_004298 [Nitrospira sp.]|nr:hypothetical protein [Nitrospira sp.]
MRRATTCLRTGGSSLSVKGGKFARHSAGSERQAGLAPFD